jgi:hypothetical protein
VKKELANLSFIRETSSDILSVALDLANGTMTNEKAVQRLVAISDGVEAYSSVFKKDLSEALNEERGKNEGP